MARKSLHKILVHFSVTQKQKAISKTQLFPNMGSEILCQFLLENNEGILERQFGQKCFSYFESETKC